MDERQRILALPTELIHDILLSLPPLCIEHFSQTCKLARHHVYGDGSTGVTHLWKRLYLQRFDDYPSLWDEGTDSVDSNGHQDAANRHREHSEAASSSSAASQSRSTSSVMSLVQLRNRAARLYAGDPSNHGPITGNFNAVLSAMLSVIDTAVLNQDRSPCLNSSWLDDSVLSSGQATWSEWVFPRTIMHSLNEYMLEHAQQSANTSPEQGGKRRRIEAAEPSADQHDADSNAQAASSRPRSSSSKSSSTERPDSTRRRSARLLKLMYPESLHGLVDQGIDIEALVQPSMRLAARIHCLHGVRAWKNAQQQRLTASPQEILAQNQQEALTNQGAAPTEANDHQQQTQNANPPSSTALQEASTAERPSETSNDRSEADNAEEEDEEDGDNDDDDDDDDDDESFDEPPNDVLRFRQRIFGPSFGFCLAPSEEEQVRARMRHRVYDCGYYGWQNGYAPLHAWRFGEPPEQLQQNGHAHMDRNGHGDEDEDEEDDVDLTDARDHGSQDGDDDALREANELSDDDDNDSQDIPDDPVPIEIEVSRQGNGLRTFQVADRNGNPVSGTITASGWDASDGEDEAMAANGTNRTPYQPPDLGIYDAETQTYTYEGDLAIGIANGNSTIQVTVGETIDFVARDELKVQFIRPGMHAETMRVTSGRNRSNGRNGSIEDSGEHTGQDGDDDDDFDEDEEDDDFDEDAEDDEEDWGHDYDLDDLHGPFYSMLRPEGGMQAYRGCHAQDEIKQLVKQHKENHKDDQSPIKCLRRKSIHWEVLEAIMVVMYANLKEAIWLENWGVGIHLPKIFDENGILVKDPMERREFLEFPTGWISSFSNPLSSGIKVKDSNPAAQPGEAEGGQDEKPFDWAGCEKFWAGTYAFLDYSHFIDFNHGLAAQRNAEIARAAASGQANAGETSEASWSNQAKLSKPSLVDQEEAVGDCLQLRLEVLPKSQQPAYRQDEEGQEDDAEFPTLYFRGTTVTYWGNEAPMPRGGVHGKVRSVYARDQDVDEMLARGPRGRKRIEGIHWSLTHVYEGEDRWQLEGIQPGPPGTRAPIFGIWTDASHEHESPNGPFVYYMMDERNWRDIDEVNRREAQEAAAARAAAAAAGNR